jgi:hypothetical protein
MSIIKAPYKQTCGLHGSLVLKPLCYDMRTIYRLLCLSLSYEYTVVTSCALFVLANIWQALLADTEDLSAGSQAVVGRIEYIFAFGAASTCM